MGSAGSLTRSTSNVVTSFSFSGSQQVTLSSNCNVTFPSVTPTDDARAGSAKAQAFSASQNAIQRAVLSVNENKPAQGELFTVATADVISTKDENSCARAEINDGLVMPPLGEIFLRQCSPPNFGHSRTFHSCEPNDPSDDGWKAGSLSGPFRAFAPTVWSDNAHLQNLQTQLNTIDMDHRHFRGFIEYCRRQSDVQHRFFQT